jgi:hypothetical protein
MLSKKSTPTTKQSLISALHQIQIEKVEVKEPDDLKDIAKNLKAFIGNGRNPVTVVFLKGRN